MRPSHGKVGQGRLDLPSRGWDKLTCPTPTGTLAQVGCGVEEKIGAVSKEGSPLKAPAKKLGFLQANIQPVWNLLSPFRDRFPFEFFKRGIEPVTLVNFLGVTLPVLVS
jgi:hypothetical protein